MNALEEKNKEDIWVVAEKNKRDANAKVIIKKRHKCRSNIKSKWRIDKTNETCTNCAFWHEKQHNRQNELSKD